MHAFVQVMLAGPGKRIRIGIQPDEKLSALAWTVSLGKGSVLGVTGGFSQPALLMLTTLNPTLLQNNQRPRL